MNNNPPKLGERIAAALAAHPVGDKTAAAGTWADALLHDAPDEILA